jgi:hypothetical protein
MDQGSLSNCYSTVKNQLALQEVLSQYLSKVDAMIEILLARDLIDFPSTKLHDYLLVMSDLVDKARSTNENSIDRLIKLYPIPLPEGFDFQ